MSAEKMEEEEEVCRKEFGFELRDLQSRLRSHADLMDSSLHRFCSQALSPAADPAARRELGFSCISDMASSCKLASDHLSHTLFSMHSTLLLHMQHEKNRTLAAALSLSIKQTLLSIHSRISSDLSFLRSHKLHQEIIQAQQDKDLLRTELASSKASFAEERARLSDDVNTLKVAMQRLEQEKEGIEAEARSRFETQKAMLEVSLREEMQACQICLENRRNVVILPCFHGQFCEDCMEEYRKTNKSCPTCRSTIRGMHPYIA